jgi:hypothetical protein
MKIALPVLLGLFLGALGGAALGVGAGLAWVEIFKTLNFEGYSGMLVFFGFMPGGAILGGLLGPSSSACWPSGTGKSPSNAPPARAAIASGRTRAFVQCKNADWFFETICLLPRLIVE